METYYVITATGSIVTILIPKEEAKNGDQVEAWINSKLAETWAFAIEHEDATTIKNHLNSLDDVPQGVLH